MDDSRDGVALNPDGFELSAPQARVLGCLMEKQATTPDAYPMTLKALTTACNQSSNRHPVVQYETTLVEATLHALKGKRLVRVVHPSHGERSTKYRHVIDENLGLDSAERSVISLLLVRGAQTVSELRSRSDRMHKFDDNAQVEAVLRSLSEREPAMVAAVERQPGQKEQRWIQLLELNAEARAAAPPSPARVSATSGAAEVDELRGRVTRLEERVAKLTDALRDLIDLDELEVTNEL